MKYPEDFINKIICGDCSEVIKKLPDESIDCLVTSPPYWALRDYGVNGQLGLEPTFQEYIKKLCDVFDEVKRVLKKEGTCWVNMGDTYASGGTERFDDKPMGKNPMVQGRGRTKDMQEKCLIQIPSRLAIEMTNRGWILRNEIIWHKPNSMPASVKDRFTVDFEKVFFFVKSKKYYFETQYEPYTEPINRWGGRLVKRVNGADEYGVKQRIRDYRPVEGGKNKRAVWSINTKPYLEAHFATYPEKLIEPMIKAGCPKEGIVLDPFFGAGTTGLVAKKQGKNYIGIELNPKYVKIAETRLMQDLLL